MKTKLLFFILITFLWRCEALECPLPDEIWPCVCFTRSTVTVRCESPPNFESVQLVLRDHFLRIPWLKLHRVHTHSLPSHALGDLLPRRLSITGSNLKRIDDAAFENQKRTLGLLILADNRLEEVPQKPLEQLTRLRTLSLNSNFLMSISRGSFRNLTELTFLFLGENRISAIDKEAFPENLDTLVLSKNHLTSLNGSLQYLKQLEQLFLNENRLTSLENELDGLDNLKLLNVHHNHISRVDKALKNLSALKDLNLAYNRIRNMDNAFENLMQIRKVNLSHNLISGLSSSSLLQLRDLKVLDLSGNYFKFMDCIIKPIPWLEELYLSDVGLEEVNFSCFKGMDRLQKLDLSANRIKIVSVHHTLRGLSSLNLSDNRIISLKKGLNGLSESLKELDISRNSFTSLKLPYHLLSSRSLHLKITDNPLLCSEHLKKQLEGLEQQGSYVEGKPNC